MTTALQIDEYLLCIVQFVFFILFHFSLKSAYSYDSAKAY